MNVPKSSAEILANALQKKQKNSRPKKIEPFAGQMSTFSAVSDARNASSEPELDNPVNNLNVRTETDTSPLQFKPISTPLSFLLKDEVHEFEEVDSELVNILIYVTCIPNIYFQVIQFSNGRRQCEASIDLSTKSTL